MRARDTQVQTVACLTEGVPGGSDSKESACNVCDPGPEDPLEEGVAAPGDSHGPRSAWGRKEWDTAERLSTQPLRVSVLLESREDGPLVGCAGLPCPRVCLSGVSPPPPRTPPCRVRVPPRARQSILLGDGAEPAVCVEVRERGRV